MNKLLLPVLMVFTLGISGSAYSEEEGSEGGQSQKESVVNNRIEMWCEKGGENYNEVVCNKGDLMGTVSWYDENLRPSDPFLDPKIDEERSASEGGGGSLPPPPGNLSVPSGGGSGSTDSGGSSFFDEEDDGGFYGSGMQ